MVSFEHNLQGGGPYMGKRENKRIDYKSDFISSIKATAYNTAKNWAGERTRKAVTYTLNYGERKIKELVSFLIRKELKCQEPPNNIKVQKKT